MSYNFKKNNLIKGLPFICFSNINAEAFKSGKDNIKVVVDDVIYLLEAGKEIDKNNADPISLNKILVNAKNWKIDDGVNYDQSLPTNLKECKLVSFTINGVENKTGDILTTLSAKTYNDIKSGLTLNFESVYKLVNGSVLTDGTNTIEIKDKVLSFSDLKGINNLDTLKAVIERNCNACKVKEENKKGVLENLTIAGGALKDFYVSNYTLVDGVKNVTDDKLESVNIEAIINEIKTSKKLILTFAKYFNYGIDNITLSTELVKTRKPKDTDINNFKTNNTNLLKKQLKQLKYSDIETKIKDLIGFNNVDINKPDNNVIAEGNVNLEIVKDDDNKFSEPMKGKITFKIDNTKVPELTFETDKGNDVDVIFGKTIVSADGVIINTDMTNEGFKSEVKKYLGNKPDIEDKYDVTFTKGFNVDNKATDDFIVTITFKDIVDGFTKKLDKTEQNITINLVIDDNSENKFKLAEGLNNTYSNQTFKKALNYSNFITALETLLSKGTGTLADAIKEVKYNNGSVDIEWVSTETKTIEKLGIKSVTVTFKKATNNYVEEVVSTPPVSGNVTFTLNVTTSVNGYKVKAGNETLNVEVAKDGLNGTKFKEEILKTFNDGKFTIKKGETVISDGDTIGTETSDLNSYSIELTEGSTFIEADNKDDNKDNNSNKNKQNGDESTEDDSNEKSKGCCGGKCSGGDKKNK